MSSPSEARSPVELLADEFLARCKRGEKPTIKEYCDRHPELADEIHDVFEAVLMVEDLKPGSNEASGSYGDSVCADGKRLERIADYRLLREIGRGGMGVVYEAEQEALSRRVALKVLPRTLAGDGKALIRFQREARAAARMHHTNIVPVFDVGQDGEHVFYAMQLIHGQGLDLVIDDLKRLRDHSTSVARSAEGAENRMPEKSIAASLLHGQFKQENLVPPEPVDSRETAAYDAVPSTTAMLPGQSELSAVESNRRGYYRSVAQIGLQTASALAYAHARGIIHRDIKPGNLLLDAAGNVWVTDFGLAKTGDSGVTHTGDILGTIRYMAPERFRGHCDVRADVYALGLTLYEMLALKPAYASADRLKLIDQIRQADPPSPRSVDPRIPLDLETIVVKAIDKDPKRRYQSADELAEDLQRFVADEPIKARRIGTLERFARWCRRNPALAASMGLAAVLLIAVATVSVVFAQSQAENSAILAKANQELDQTNQDLVSERDKTGQALKASQEHAEINRRQLARMSVDQATKRMDDGDLFGALVLSTHARELDAGEPEREAIHRQRIASILQQCPRPVQVWNYARVVLAQLSRDGKYVLIVSSNQQPIAGKWFEGPRRVQVWELATGKVIEPWKAAGDDVFFANLSPDGRRVGTVRGDRSKLVYSEGRPLLSFDVETWDLATQTRIGPPIKIVPGTFLRGSTSSMESLFSVAIPTKEPSGPRRAEVAVWDTATGKQRVAWPIDLDPSRLPELGRSIAFFDPAGKHAITIGPTLQLWDATTGKLQQTLDGKEFSKKASEAIFSPDARLVLVYGEGGRIYRTDTGARIGKELFNRDANITSAEFSPDGKLIATASHDHTARLWDAATGAPVTAPLVHDGQVVHVSFSADGRRIVTACNGGAAWIWDAVSGKQEGTRLPHGGLVKRAQFSPDGRHVLTYGSDGAVKLWDLATTETGGRLLRRFGRHGRFSPDGRMLATLTWTGHVQLWDTATGQMVPNFDQGGQQMAIGLAFSPDGKVLAFGRSDAAAIRLWDVGKRVRLRDLETRGQVSFLAFSADGRRLVANCELPSKDSKAGATYELTVWDVADPQVTTPLIRIANATNPWQQMAVSADARLAALVDKVGPAVYDLATGQRQVSLQPNSYSRYFAFSPDGSMVAAGCDEGELRVRVWNSKTGEALWQRDHFGWVHTVNFSHDGGRLLSASYDGTARVWNAKTGEPLLVITHRAPLNGAYFSRDGRLVVTLSVDKTARVWEAATGQPITPPLPHTGAVTREAGFSPDGSRLFTASSGDDNLWLWELRQETQPPSSLKRLARTLAARELGGDGLLLHHAASDDDWKELRRDWPEGFRATKKQEIAWHAREARAYGAAKLWSNAVLHWQRLVELEPKSAFFQMSLGDALANAGQLPAAIQASTRAAELLPLRNFPLVRVAELHVANRDIGAYRRICAKLFDEYKDSDDLNNFNNVCWAMCFAPDAHPELRSLADRAVKLLTKDAKNHNALNTAGCFLYQAGRDDEALKWLQAALQADPSGEGHAYDWIFLAMVHKRQGRPEEARKWLDKAKAYVTDASSGGKAPPVELIPLEYLIREAAAVLADDGEGLGGLCG